MIGRTMQVLHRSWVSATVLGLASLLLYSININSLPHHDEFYHMLAAEGLLATGEPAIGDEGRYWRAYSLTWLVAQSFALFGSSLATARLPALVFMVALVVLLFLFLRRHADAAAAWIGAGLFAVSPFAIEIAQFVRFYSLQCLAFFAAAWIAYDLSSRPFKAHRHLLLGVLALSLIVFAMQLQLTTAFGVIGLGIWLGGALLLPWLGDPTVPRSRKLTLVLVLVLAGLVALGVAGATGLLATLWISYRTTALFNEPTINHVWYYHAWYSLLYPTLWTLSGLLAVLALIKWPRLASFLLTVFVIGFLFNSFGASKNTRYLAYAQPFLFALWGLGLAVVLGGAGRFLGSAREQLATQLVVLPGHLSRGIATGVVGAAILFVILANPAWLRSFTLLSGITIPPELPPTRWERARPVLDPVLQRVDKVVTTEDLAMLYYFGRADYLLSASRLGEQPTGNREHFTPDFRTDVPIIVDSEDLELIVACHASGIFLTNAAYWIGGERTRADVEGVAPLVFNQMQHLDLPADSRLVAFVWDHEPAARRSPYCDRLPR